MNAHTPPPCFTPRAKIARPALAQWLWERDYDWREAGQLFGVSHATVWAWCLPFADERRSAPRPKQAAVIQAITVEIGPDSFKPPEPGGPA